MFVAFAFVVGNTVELNLPPNNVQIGILPSLNVSLVLP